MTIFDAVMRSSQPPADPLSRAELLSSCADIPVSELNRNIVEILDVAAEMRGRAYRLMDCATILSDEVRRRAEILEDGITPHTPPATRRATTEKTQCR